MAIVCFRKGQVDFDGVLIVEDCEIRETHTQECHNAQATYNDWHTSWPMACETCDGLGLDWEPGDSSVGEMDYLVPCYNCVCESICPRCGSNSIVWKDDEHYSGCNVCGWEYAITYHTPTWTCYCNEAIYELWYANTEFSTHEEVCDIFDMTEEYLEQSDFAYKCYRERSLKRIGF